MSSRNPDAAFDTAREIAETRFFEYPIERDQTARIVYRNYVQNVDDHSPMALDTEDDVFADHFLVSERITKKVDKLIWFERAFATIPATRDEPLKYAYTFPAFLHAADERPPLTKPVLARVEYAYFLNDDPTDPTTGITLIPAFKIVLDTEPDYEVQFVSDAVVITDPDLTAYQALIAGEDELVAEVSDVVPYRGNIWERRTIYVVAQ